MAEYPKDNRFNDWPLDTKVEMSPELKSKFAAPTPAPSGEAAAAAEELNGGSKVKDGFTQTENGTPILTEPFTHAQVDDYYEAMYDHVAADQEPSFDLRTLEAVHNFFEFETNSGMMLDAWLHAQLQKVTGKSYSPKKNKPW